MNQQNEPQQRSQGNVEIEAIGSVISAAIDLMVNEDPDDPATEEHAHAIRYALVQYINLSVAVNADGTEIDSSGAPSGSVEDIDVAGNKLLRLTEGLTEAIEKLELQEELRQLRHAVAGLAVSIARFGAKLDTLEPVAESFAVLADETHEPARAATLGYLMEEAIDAFNPMYAPTDASRKMYLKWGSVATHSHDTELMQRAFDRMGKIIPGDLPVFFRKAVDEMEQADHPPEVKAVLQAYYDRQPC